MLVIVGNPPYSGISSNINDWTEKLLKEDLDGAQSYYKVDDESLGEKKLWLQDDYVKFLRFAQWKIHKAGFGIVGMITNHSYLDNPTFRGMRQSLMNTFDEIYILDLHGNSNKKRPPQKGAKTKMFSIYARGVAIALFIKKKLIVEEAISTRAPEIVRGIIPLKTPAKVFHSELFGLREEKYSWLSKHKLNAKLYNRLKPGSPWVLLHSTRYG